MLEDLKEQVWQANRDLARRGLAALTWGNVSGIDRARGLVAIKPSGAACDDAGPADMAVVDLEGRVVEGRLKPSSDTPTHVVLYKAFEKIGGVTHTHSSCATMFAQAQSEIPCFGTTHADHFYGPVPITRSMRQEEVESEYEANTGKLIVERFEDVDPGAMPAVLVANHGPFTWGKDAAESLRNAIALEEVAKMALGTLQIDPEADAIASYLLDRHYFRKHGAGAYYGQG
ncbi:MAG TPA: L-ribulose-5-phosphate 4-epimerase [Sumerlaeia bacterium]|nr:L-ribulose-5-phosphate 4-epimerase [Sumerlaeia bacterium]